MDAAELVGAEAVLANGYVRLQACGDGDNDALGVS